MRIINARLDSQAMTTQYLIGSYVLSAVKS